MDFFIILLITFTAIVILVLAQLIKQFIENTEKRIQDTQDKAEKTMERLSARVDDAVKIAEETSSDFAATQRQLTQAAADTGNQLGVMANTVSETAEAVNLVTNRTSDIISSATEQSSLFVQTAMGWITMSQMLSITIVIISLSRQFYKNLIKKKDDKEAISTERDVFKVLDGLAVVCIIPLMFTDGVKGAIGVWKWIKTIGGMVKDSAAFYNLYSRAFATDTEKDVFIGQEFVNGLSQSAEEVMNRVDEVKQGLGIDITEERKSSDDSILGIYGPNNSTPPAPSRKKYCTLCVDKYGDKRADCHHAGKIIFADLFVEEDAADDGFKHIRKLWATQETQAELNDLRKKVEVAKSRNPWVVPMTMVLLMAGVLLAAKLYEKYLKDAPKNTIIRFEARKRKSGKTNKPWIDYDKNDSNLLDQFRKSDQFGDDYFIDDKGRKWHVDEQGQISAFRGAGYGDYGAIREESKDSTHHVNSFKKQITKRIMKCFCCGENHHVRDCTKTMHTKKEAILNSTPQIDCGAIAESVGWAETEKNRQCCTTSFNGVVVSEHVHDNCLDDNITFDFGDISFNCKWSSGINIARDTIFFKLPAGITLKTARVAKPKTQEVVALVCYKDKDSMKRKTPTLSSGVIKNIIELDGAERASTNYSSVAGNCGAPVINAQGKVVGFHNATSGYENYFIPVTDLMIKKTGGSVF